MDRLCIQVFGTFQASLGGKEIDSFSSNKVRGLLAFLSVEANQPHTREKLAGLFWPDFPEESARASLRSALANLRHVIGDRARGGVSCIEPFLFVSRQAIQFNPSTRAWVDAVAFTKAVKAADLASLEQATHLYRGDFLEGFSLHEASIFEEWALLSRERYRRLVIESLERLADGYRQQGDYEKALPFACRQVELDPWQETAHQQLMFLLAINGRRTDALAQYETCCRLLVEEFGVLPTEKTIALHEQIRSGQLAPLQKPQVQPRKAAEKTTLLHRKVEAVGFEKPVFVARQHLLTRLHTSLDSAITGRSRIELICGSAGSGKTALIAEFARQAMEKQRDLLVACGECSAYAGFGDPYLPFRGILAMLTGDMRAYWSAGVIHLDHPRRLQKSIPTTIEALLDLGPQVLDAFFHKETLITCALMAAIDSDLWLKRLNEWGRHERTSSEHLDQSQLFQQTTNVLRQLSVAHPLLLILDDLQWSDAASLGLLFHLGRRMEGSRMMLLIAYRPEEIPQFMAGEPHPLQKLLAEFRRTYGDIDIDLDQDDKIHGRDFVDAFLNTQPNRLGEDFRRVLFSRTAGQPLFTIELLRAMQDRGDLRQDQTGCWAAGPDLNWEMMPARVEGVIQERLDCLDQDLREILNVASVEGEQFTPQIISQVLGVNERSLLKNLSQDFERRHRLVHYLGGFQTPRQRLVRYRFAHALFQQYLYATMSPGERQLLHKEIAAALEYLYQGRIEDIAPQLARHYSEAGNDKQALRYLTLAADAALASYANDEAEMCFRKALGLASDDSQSAHLLEGLGQALYRQSRFTEAIRVWQEGIQRNNNLGDLDGVARLYGRSSDAAWWGGDPPLGLHLSQEGLEAAANAPESPGIACLLHSAAKAYFFDGAFDRANTLCQQASEMAERLGIPDEEADILATLGGLCGQKPEEALKLLTDAVDLAESRNLLQITSQAYNDLAIIKGTIYGPKAGCNDLERSIVLSRKVGNIAHEVLASGNLIKALLPLGEIEQAEACLNRIRGLTNELEDPGSSIQRVKRLEATVFFYRGEWLKAISLLRPLQAEFRRQNHLMALFVTDSLVARVLIEMNSWKGCPEYFDWDEVESTLAEAIQLGHALAETDALIWCYSRLAALKAAQGRIKEAVDLLSRARLMAKGWAYPSVETALLWGKAKLVIAEHRWEEAIDSFGSLVKIYRQCSMKWDLARTLVELASAMISKREASQAHKVNMLLQEAQTLYQEMGLNLYITLVQDQLDALSNQNRPIDPSSLSR